LALLCFEAGLLDELDPGVHDDAGVVVVGRVEDEEAQVEIVCLVGVFVVEL
jgi:hypothetical protein